MVNLKHKMSQTQWIAAGFLLIILIGMLLLMLPISTRAGGHTGWADALFTSTSATCVTGLVVYDTFTHWTTFGQCVILTLIQIGGLGFMTCVTLLAVFFRRKVGLQDRMMLMQSAGMFTVSGAVRLIRRVALGTFTCELAGAAVLATQFVPAFGWGMGLYQSVFHAISAFCNAGFDLLGIRQPGSSLVTFAANPVVNITIMLLIIFGGLGFLVWSDMFTCRFRAHDFQMHTKLVLVTTGVLIAGGAVLFYLFENKNTLAGMTFGEQVLASIFQSVTPRTAGFNTVDMTALSEPGAILETVLMFIGGSPGSTAGGIKTTTFAVFVLSALANTRPSNEVHIFKYRMDDTTLRQASSVFCIYFFMVLIVTTLLCTFETLPFRTVVFETVSAIGTVGLSVGVTAATSVPGRLLLAMLMYAGRIGGMTFFIVLSRNKPPAPLARPVGKVLIG